MGLSHNLPWMVAQGPQMTSHSAPSFEVPGDKIQDQNIQVLGFIDPSDQNEQYHTPLLSKIWDLIERRKILWDYPFNEHYHPHCYQHHLLLQCNCDTHLCNSQSKEEISKVTSWQNVYGDDVVEDDDAVDVVDDDEDNFVGILMSFLHIFQWYWTTFQ